MKSIIDIADEIVAREGGFVIDPDDPGGPTNRGVTQSTAQAAGLDVTGDGRVDLADIKALTPKDARDLFIRRYFYAPKINQLPTILHATVFDMQVNAGAHAIRILQRLLTEMGFSCAVDGALGPQTLGQAAAAAVAAPDHLADAYGIARRDYYYRLADQRPASRKFARRRDGGKGGWITRAESFISPKYHLTAAEHAKRVAAWA